MIFSSGFYHPVSQLRAWLQRFAGMLPLGTAVSLIQPLLLGQGPDASAADIGILVAYCAAGFYITAVLTRRRLLK